MGLKEHSDLLEEELDQIKENNKELIRNEIKLKEYSNSLEGELEQIKENNKELKAQIRNNLIVCEKEKDDREMRDNEMKNENQRREELYGMCQLVIEKMMQRNDNTDAIVHTLSQKIKC